MDGEISMDQERTNLHKYKHILFCLYFSERLKAIRCICLSPQSLYQRLFPHIHVTPFSCLLRGFYFCLDKRMYSSPNLLSVAFSYNISTFRSLLLCLSSFNNIPHMSTLHTPNDMEEV